MADDKSKIHVDDDWKAQARREKEKLSEKEKPRGQAEQSQSQRQTGETGGQQGRATQSAGGGQRQQLPEAGFSTLVSSFLTQAMLAMGLLSGPDGKTERNLDLARFNISMLEVLEAKTKGNLSEDEQNLLNQALHQARMSFVEVASGSGPVG